MNEGNGSMHISRIADIFVVFALALTLGACARRSETPIMSTLGEDDDAFCRSKGAAVGSADYVSCRKDRDVLRSNAGARADRTQRNLGEMMLNKPEDGPRRGF